MKYLSALVTLSVLLTACTSVVAGPVLPPTATPLAVEPVRTTPEPVATATPVNPYSLPTGGIVLPTLDLSLSANTQEPTVRHDNPIQALINEAVRTSAPTVMIPPGIYRLDSGLYFKNIKNLTVEGNGAQLVFTLAKASNAPYSNAMVIQDCDGLTLRNFIVDYDPLPFTQGTVVELDPEGAWADVQIHTGYRPDAQFLQFDVDRKELSLHLFDPKTGLLKLGSSFLFPDQVTETAPGVLRFWFKNNPDKAYQHHIEVGDYLATAAWRAVPFNLRGAANTKLDNVTIWAAGGAAIDEKRGEGGTDLKINLEPGPLPTGAMVQRLWSASRDGYHVGLVRRGPIVHDSRFISMSDDMINVHTYYFQVSRLEAAEKRIAMAAYNHGYAALFQAGDTIIAYDPVTFIKKARTSITSVRPGNQLELESVQGFVVGDILASPQTSASGTIIRDSIFRNGDAGGLAIKSPDTLIENNQIEHIGMDGIGVNVYLNYYYEGTFGQGMVIRGNTIRDTGFSALILYRAWLLTGALNVGFAATEDNLQVTGNREFKNIVIENNIIDGTTTWGLALENVSGVTVRGNQISNVVNLPPGYVKTWWSVNPVSAIYVSNADHVTFTDNVVSALGPNASQAIVLDSSVDAATVDVSGIQVRP